MVGGISPYEGRVEICLDEEYSTVCDQMWDVTDASIACRQLGHSDTGLFVVIMIPTFCLAKISHYYRSSSFNSVRLR